MKRSISSAIVASALLTGCTPINYQVLSSPVGARIDVNANPNIQPPLRVNAPATVALKFDSQINSYHIEASKEGYIGQSKYISKQDAESDKMNSNLNINFLLNPIICNTNVTSNAVEAEVFLDGSKKGVEPIQLDLVYGDTLKHTIEIKKDGYEPKSVDTTYTSCKTNEGVTIAPVMLKYDITTYPEGTEVTLDGVKLGKTPLTSDIEFGKYGTKRTLKFKKYGYLPNSQEIHFDDKLTKVLVKMEEAPYRDLAYIEPEISMKDQTVLFKIQYERGYRETIDNSPNALHVKQIVSMDNINHLIGDLDAQGGKVVYSVVYPQDLINTEAYIENVRQIKLMISGLEDILTDKKASAVAKMKKLGATSDEEVLKNIKSDLYAYFLNLVSVIEQDGGVGKYEKELGDLKFSYEKVLQSYLSLNVTNFYSDIWLTDNTKGFRKSKITDTDRRWVDSSPSIDNDNIYFASNRNSKDFEIWRISANGGSGMTKITNSPYSQDMDPSTSVNGELVSYTSIPMDSINQQVWTINKKGYLPSQLKIGYQTSIGIDKIVFVRKSKFTNKNQLWVMNVDGSAETILTDERYNCFDPSISKDGKHIVFTSDQSGNKDIWIMGIDGSDLTQLTTNPSADIKPAFDEKGNVVFSSNRGMIWGIWSLTPKI